MITYGSASRGEAVEQRGFLLLGRALKEVALAAQLPFLAEVLTCFFDAVVGHTEHQVVIETVAILQEAGG